MKPATPLPWTSVAPSATRNVSSFSIRSGDRPIAALSYYPYTQEARNRTEADAAYIVAACNAYPQLLDDRRRLVEALRCVAIGPRPGAWPNVAVNNARALLAEIGEAD